MHISNTENLKAIITLLPVFLHYLDNQTEHKHCKTSKKYPEFRVFEELQRGCTYVFKPLKLFLVDAVGLLASLLARLDPEDLNNLSEVVQVNDESSTMRSSG